MGEVGRSRSEGSGMGRGVGHGVGYAGTARRAGALSVTSEIPTAEPTNAAVAMSRGWSALVGYALVEWVPRRPRAGRAARG